MVTGVLRILLRVSPHVNMGSKYGILTPTRSNLYLYAFEDSIMNGLANHDIRLTCDF